MGWSRRSEIRWAGRAPILFLILFATPAARAQTNNEGLANLQFNFLNPGARPLGMGGAFVAMADDATTALANPAGLLNLTRPEAGIELASTRFENEIPWASGTATCSQTGNSLTEFSYAFSPRRFPSTLNGLSFVSLVYPVRPRELVLSLFYDNQTRFERSFNTDGFPLQHATTGRTIDFFYPVESTLSYQQRTVGISAAIRVADRLALGGTLAYAAFSMHSSLVRSGQFLSHQTLDGNDGGLAATAGLTLLAGKRLHIALAFTRRPSFDLTYGYTEEGGALEGSHRGRVGLDVPDRLAAGISWRLFQRLSINADLVRVFSSDLMQRYYNAYYNPEKRDDAFLSDPQAGKRFYEVRDGTELRLGVEYVRVVRLRPLALRAGYWREPFHRMVRKENDAEVIFDISAPADWHYEPYSSRSFIEMTHHATAGLGLALNRFSVDIGYDYSRTTRRLVASAVFYF